MKYVTSGLVMLSESRREREDLIEEPLLVVVHVLRVGLVEEQIPAQLEHVVHDARLGVVAVVRLGVERARDRVALAQDLADADAAVAVDPVRHDHVPEVLRRRVVVPLVALLEDAEVADELRDVLVRVTPVEDVVVRDRRVLHVAVVEVPRDGEVLRLAR